MPTLLTTLIRKYPPVFPAGYCWPSPQQYAIDFTAGLTLEFASDIGNIAYNMGDTLPSAANRIFPWLRTIAGFPDDWFFFANGSWLAEYRRAPPDPNWGMIWFGSEAQLETLDGGEAGTPTTTAGPFWVRKTELNGRSPMGIGDIPNANPAKSLAVGENYGEGSRLQLETELAAHIHPLQAAADIQDNNNVKVITSGGATESGLFKVVSSGNADTPLSVGANDPGVDQARMPVIHPVYGVIFAVRTIRQYRRVDV